MTVSVDLLGPEGPIAKGLRAYETREEQLSMAEATEKALFNGHHLVVEAGTGVGKSFAYLVPAVLYARQTGSRVIVTTHTIALQEQLVGKDIPFLAEHLGVPFTAVLAKGRSNYLCIRRLYQASQHETMLFEEADELKELYRIVDWACTTQDGSLSDVAPPPSADVWEKVCAERGNCRGTRCEHFKKCFYQRARRRLRDADVIVANHSLFFSDLVMHKKRGGFLPQYSAVVFDEAHSVENVACEHFGIEVSNFGVRYLLNALYNPKTGKGFLTVVPDNALRRQVEDLHSYADSFFEEVGDWLDTRAPSNGRVEEAMGVTDLLSEPLKALAKALRQARSSAENEDDELELTSYSGKCLDMAFAVEHFLARTGDDSVFWVERGGRRNVRITLNAAPVSAAPYMREFVYSEVGAAVFTSATLAVGGDDRFEYLRGRLGLDTCETLRLGSPFDYYRQVRLVIAPSMPAPTDGAFVPAAARAIEKYVLETKGRAFVLFTSYQTLGAVYERAAANLKAAGITCYRQGLEMPRSSMLAKFREGKAACIFGTDSFWQGVDVPGEALSNVIIARLPFPVPDRPLTAARLERIRDEGGDPFMEYSLPEAVLKFKQGFGRLIRTKTDTGIVVVLDRRILDKWYGRAFLDSIPKCEIVTKATA